MSNSVMGGTGIGMKRKMKVKVAGGVEAGFSYSECGRREAHCLLSCPMLTSTRSPSSPCVCVFSLMPVCAAARFLPLSRPITVHTLCLNTNTTPLSLSSQLSVCALSPPPVSYSDGVRGFSVGNQCEGSERRTHSFSAESCYDALRENGRISL